MRNMRNTEARPPTKALQVLLWFAMYPDAVLNNAEMAARFDLLRNKVPATLRTCIKNGLLIRRNINSRPGIACGPRLRALAQSVLDSAPTH